MHLVDAAEEVVHVAHDILISAGEKNPQRIPFHALTVFAQRMKRQRVAGVLEVDVLLHGPVAVAGDINQRGIPRGFLVQPRERHDGEQLVQRPVILQALKHAEVANVLVAHAVLELADLLGHMVALLIMGTNLGANLPVQRLHLCLGVQLKYTQGKHVMRVLLTLLRLVIGGQLIVATIKVAANFQQLVNQHMLVIAVLQTRLEGFADGTESLHHQHAVMRHDRPAALADDGRMRHLLGIAHLADGRHHVVGVFAQRVIGAALERRPATVVIHREAAAYVQIIEREIQLAQLGIKPRALLHRGFDREDIRHLRANMKV